MTLLCLIISMKIVFLALFGLAWGSFVNAFVWRLRQQELASQKSKSRKSKVQSRKYSIVHGRSMCVHCKHVLAWYDLLPVVSWVMLRGKCRYCKKPISWQYPAVELTTSGLFVGSYLAWPYGFDAASWTLFALWLVFLLGFIALAVYDLKWMELPNKLVYPLIGLAIAQVFVKSAVNGNFVGSIAGAFLGFAVIGGLFYGLFQLSGGKWIGGGDVKLAFMIGPLVGGVAEATMVIFFASVLGTLVSLPLMANKSLRISSRIPFGPFLLVATIIVYLYGESIINWYASGLL